MFIQFLQDHGRTIILSAVVIIVMSVGFFILLRIGKRGEVKEKTRQGKVIILDEHEDRFRSEYEKENWN